MKRPQGTRTITSKTAPKVERIYRILLDLSWRNRSIYAISKEAKTDYHWTHTIINEIERMGVLNKNNVVYPDLLFKTWSNRPVNTLFREYHIQDPGKWIQDRSEEHAVTTYYAENKVGQYLLPRSLDIYIRKDDSMIWHENIMKVGYAGSGNVRLLVGDEHVFWHSKNIEGLNIVSIQQLIVDLLREGGVCLEAAQNLIERYYDKKRDV